MHQRGSNSLSRFVAPLLFSSFLLLSCLPSEQQQTGETESLEEILEVESDPEPLVGEAGSSGRKYFIASNTQNCQVTAQGVHAQVKIKVGGREFLRGPFSYVSGCDAQGKLREYSCRNIRERETTLLASKVVYGISSCPSGQYCSRGEKSCKNLCGNGRVDQKQGEQCDGAECCNAKCTFAPSGKECRAADGQCDAPEYCDGKSASCPEKVVAQCQQTVQDQTLHPSFVKPEIKNVKTPGYTALIDASEGIVGSISRDKVISLVDISDPASPKILQTLDTPGFAEASYNNGEYLFVGDSKELKFFSLDTPLGEPLGTYPLHDFWPSAMTVNKNYAYMVSGSKMLIVNIENPQKPSEISRISLTGNAPTEIQVQGEYAYIVETLGGLNIVDIHDPAKPEVVKVFPFQSHTAGFEIKDNYAYLGRIASIASTATGYATTSVFEVIDISQPASARVISSQEIATDIRGLGISKGLDGSKDYAYVIGSYPHRLTAIDIGSPADPKILSTSESIVGDADLQDIVVSEGYAFIADGTAGLRIVDLRNPDKPMHVKDLNLEGRAFTLHPSKNKLYVHVELQYFNVVDARNKNEPKLSFSERYTSAYPTASIVVKNKKAYLKTNAFKIYDLSDPYKPNQLNKNQIEVDSIQVQGNYLYSTIGEIGLLVYDLADVEQPQPVSRTPFPEGIPRDVSVDGSWAVGISNVPYSITVLDISSPGKPQFKGSYRFEKYPNSVTVKDNYVYVARGMDGVDIFKIKEGVPELIKNLKGEGYAQSVAVRENQAFIVREGVEIFDVTNPGNPILKDTIKIQGEAIRVAVDNEEIYVANGFSGVGILDSPPTTTPPPSSSGSTSSQTNRQSPEIPSESERATLPDCAGKEFTVFPVNLEKVYEIAPLGSVNPPGHTFPTEHTYLHLQAGGTSTKMYPLSSPADVFITSISRGTGFTNDPEDYTLYFALCKEVIGYYNHIKELSPDLKKIFNDADATGKCKQNSGDTSYTYCQNALNPISAGALMGQVGRLQGNFDFGLIDLRITLPYVKPSRYGERSKHIQCPYEYYPSAMREKFFEKILRNDQEQCGKVAYDVAGTLQGNWFYATARADAGTDWTQYLALVYDNFNPAQQVISIGGILTSAGKWYFTPQSSGEMNRRFSEVKADGKMYCYEGGDGRGGIQPGRILMQLVSNDELQIEHQQSKSCSAGNYVLGSPKNYKR